MVSHVTQTSAAMDSPTDSANDDDLITNTLSCFPSNSLASFMTSCKRWLSLTSDLAFTAITDSSTISGFILHVNSYWNSTYTSCSHYGLSPLPLLDPSLSFINKRLCPAPTSPMFQEPDPKFKIWSSSNGLILCSKIVRPTCTFPRIAPFISCICNPTTNYYESIPRPSASFVIGAGLAFDPSISPLYRIVCFEAIIHNILERGYEIQFEVYCSETGRWESAGGSWMSVGVFGQNGVYWGGAVNWVTYEGLLVSVDVELGKMLEIEASTEKIDSDVLYFGESRGRLHLITTEAAVGRHYDAGAECFDVLEMRDRRSGWRVMYHVDLRGMEGLYPGIYVEESNDGKKLKKLDIWPVYVVPGEEEEEEEDEVVISMPGEIVAYGLQGRSFRRLCAVSLTGAGEAEGGRRRALRVGDVTPYTLTPS